jgi:hypothetical protein
MLKSVTIKMAVITGMFMLTFLPVYTSFMEIGTQVIPYNTYYLDTTFPFVLINSMIQPCFYMAINTKIRQTLLELVCCRK